MPSRRRRLREDAEHPAAAGEVAVGSDVDRSGGADCLRRLNYRFDLAEAEQRRAEEEASLTGWQRFVRAIEDFPGREPTPRVRTKTPPSCCGCSCGSCVVVVALVAVTITLGGLGVTGSVLVAIAAAVLASRLLNAAVQRPPVARVLRLPNPALEERITG